MKEKSHLDEQLHTKEALLCDREMEYARLCEEKAATESQLMTFRIEVEDLLHAKEKMCEQLTQVDRVRYKHYRARE
jgi:hypothetical protein